MNDLEKTDRELREAQRAFYRSGATRGREHREGALRLLYASIKRHEGEILAALRADLGKGEFEAFSNEVGLVYREISHALPSPPLDAADSGRAGPAPPAGHRQDRT